MRRTILLATVFVSFTVMRAAAADAPKPETLLQELKAWLERAHDGLQRGARRTCARHATRIESAGERLRRAPLLALERRRARLDHAHGRLRALSPRATLERGYAIVRTGTEVVREPPAPGTEIGVEVAGGRFGARSE